MLEAFVSVLGMAFLGIFGWVIQLGNRVSVVETENKGLRELINTRFDGVDGRLDRIERSMNGHLMKDTV